MQAPEFHGSRRLTRYSVLVLLATSISCLGADTVSSDAGRFPELQLVQSAYILDMQRPSTKFASIDVKTYNYSNYVRFTVDSAPAGIVVTLTPEIAQRSVAMGTLMTVKVTDAATSREHRIVIRASGVVVRSTRTAFAVRVQ